MELTGKIIKVLDHREGDSQRGHWMLNTYLLETNGRYPKKMQFEVFGEDKIKKFNIEGLMGANQEVTVSFDIDASEYNGKWYNSIRAYDVRANFANANAQQMAAQEQKTDAPADPLPFDSDKLPY